jgi:acyl carrier protein
VKSVEERVYAVLGNVLQVPSQELGPQLSPETVGGWDSLRHLDLTMALEEEFGVQFTVDEISSMQSAAAIVNAVRAHTRIA